MIYRTMDSINISNLQTIIYYINYHEFCLIFVPATVLFDKIIISTIKHLLLNIFLWLLTHNLALNLEDNLIFKEVILLNQTMKM